MPIKKQPSQHKGSKLFEDYALKSVEDVLKALNVSPDQGLSNQEAKDRKIKIGPNSLKTETVHWWQILLKQVTSPFIYILVLIALIDFMLHQVTDGLMILAIVVVNTFFSFYQEFKTYHALQLLKQYIKDQSNVIRGGELVALDAADIVPGDIIYLNPGDRIPADIRFIAIDKIMLDESILTGESSPVQKTIDPIGIKPTLFEAANIGFSGTTISSGSGLGVVFATGPSSYFGSIAQLAQESPQESSFTLGIKRFSKFILLLIIITVAVVFLLHLFLNRQLSLINLITFSLALGISIIPEALPIVITFSLARGALHLAKFKLIIKRLASIEDLGSMEIFCTDKTGTLTEGQLQFKNIFGADREKVLFYGTLASGLSPEQLIVDTGFNGPLWDKLPSNVKKAIGQCKIISEHPFEPQLRYTSLIACLDTSCEHIIRGNIDETLSLCAGLTKEQQKEIKEWELQENKEARRVLLIATKKSKKLEKITPHDEKGFTFVGLISYEDPLKATASESLERAHNLGVTIKIMSGDTLQVNYAIAQKMHLIHNESEIISGEQFDKVSAQEKRKLVEHCMVFAHIVPQQKVEIIQLLEKKYDTGYMGDGINDAPALKVAHVSMAVKTAVDVTRDVADIILLKKSLHVIVDGIHEGRIIFANIIKYIKSTLAANFGHFYSLAILSLFINFLPLLPVQLLLISLLTDFPLIAISTDTVNFEDIKLPPKYNLQEIVLVTMLLGIVVMCADVIIFFMFYKQDPAILQTNWFIASILIELSFFYSIRTKLPFFKASFPSLYVLSLSLFVAGISLGLPFTSFGQNLLHFHAPTMHDLGIIAAVTIGYFIVTDSIKLIFYRLYPIHLK